ncbi:hypothetical protein GWI33_018247 [Rhynchophorus ferrugineus]|uniref:Uncharacterized protein n=1 Tax=Rhynchophorus ferrugineus TaxID=354439 RepID=A0A834HWR6_RHYFE|nr:hypothetical protein GWI33_018247 [Rhynchophorus ferrugineus]
MALISIDYVLGKRSAPGGDLVHYNLAVCDGSPANLRAAAEGVAYNSIRGERDQIEIKGGRGDGTPSTAPNRPSCAH